MIEHTPTAPLIDGPAGGGPAPALWQRIAAAIDGRADRMIRFRRRVHATPEPSGRETATTALVAETLREAGLAPRIMRDDVGVIADLDIGAEGGRRIALRCELDAVRVNDDKQVPYASTRPGLCHACGHDAHTAMVLFAALALHEQCVAKGASHEGAEGRRAEDGQGTVNTARTSHSKHNLRFIFQPAEELATGARSMIEQGALDGVEAIIALHVDPLLDPGVVAIRAGALTAACKIFTVTVRGRSGHSARPHEALDPIPAAVNIVSMFYQLGPRSIDGRNPLSLTVASITAGASFNAIPDEATISGTLRTGRIEDMQAVQQRMDAVVRGVAESTGCEAALEFEHYAPPTDNHPVVVAHLAEAAREIAGAEKLTRIGQPSMGAEDFAFYQELIPGAMARLGAGPGGKRTRRPLHSSHFDIDESVLPLGAKVLCRAALSLAAGFGSAIQDEKR